MASVLFEFAPCKEIKELNPISIMNDPSVSHSFQSLEFTTGKIQLMLPLKKKKFNLCIPAGGRNPEPEIVT